MQSRVFSVGNGVLWAEADVGIAATQAIVDVSYGPKALALLRAGMTPGAIIKAISDSDPDPRLDGRPWPKAGRQFAVMDAKGNYAALHRAEGDRRGPATRAGSSAPRRATSLPARPWSTAWSRRSRRRTGHLSLRLMAALDAGQAGGRRHARHAVGRDADRQEERRRVAEQRRRAAPAGRRQPASRSRNCGGWSRLNAPRSAVVRGPCPRSRA